ncbi:hypothetical protein R1sor_000213 [Riccia sorocarpa]|uniref:Uncharacterized protein n=1 Tax=Riccia sorocarpa TaxID=122646 RepID=A0ABD3GU55_9MARC
MDTRRSSLENVGPSTSHGRLSPNWLPILSPSADVPKDFHMGVFSSHVPSSQPSSGDRSPAQHAAPFQFLGGDDINDRLARMNVEFSYFGPYPNGAFAHVSLPLIAPRIHLQLQGQRFVAPAPMVVSRPIPVPLTQPGPLPIPRPVSVPVSQPAPAPVSRPTPVHVMASSNAAPPPVPNYISGAEGTNVGDTDRDSSPDDEPPARAEAVMSVAFTTASFHKDEHSAETGF